MVEHHTAPPTDATDTDPADQENTVWSPIATSGLIVASTPAMGKTHAMRALLLDALVEGGDRG